MRETSGQAVVGIAAAARAAGTAGSTARLTAVLAVTLGVAAACWIMAIRRMSGMEMGGLGQAGLVRVVHRLVGAYAVLAPVPPGTADH